MEPKTECVGMYKALEQGQMRVLHIDRHPGSPIRCRLEHRPVRWVGKFNPYMTLSYAWGETFEDGSHLTEQVICNGVAVRVTATLERALRSIRRKLDSGELVQNVYALPQTEARPPIWVDAVCINQLDTRERSHQVQQMAEIYANSSRLIVWLDQPRYSSAAMLLGPSWQRVTEPGYTSLAQAAWFQRRWVIQEYGLTPFHSRFLLLGDRMFLACDLRDRIEYTLKRLKLGAGPLTYDSSGCDPCESLLHNLYRFDTAECSNPHDLVYSLLSLSRTSGETEGIVVDYSKCIEDVFVEVSESILRADTKIERLSALLALATTKPRVQGGRPSWVLDWRHPSTYRCLEQEHAITFLFDLIGSERRRAMSLSRRTRQTVAHQLARNEYLGQRSLSHSHKVEGRYLRIVGRFLKPCFPPTHTSRRALFDGDDTIMPVACWTCELFSGAWTEFSDEAKSMLTDPGNHYYFVLPHTTIVFILQPKPLIDEFSGESVPRFELVSCIDAESHLKFYWNTIDPTFVSLRKWLQIFADEDEVLLC